MIVRRHLDLLRGHLERAKSLLLDVVITTEIFSYLKEKEMYLPIKKRYLLQTPKRAYDTPFWKLDEMIKYNSHRFNSYSEHGHFIFLHSLFSGSPLDSLTQLRLKEAFSDQMGRFNSLRSLIIQGVITPERFMGMECPNLRSLNIIGGVWDPKTNIFHSILQFLVRFPLLEELLLDAAELEATMLREMGKPFIKHSSLKHLGFVSPERYVEDGHEERGRLVIQQILPNFPNLNTLSFVGYNMKALYSENERDTLDQSGVAKRITELRYEGPLVLDRNHLKLMTDIFVNVTRICIGRRKTRSPHKWSKEKPTNIYFTAILDSLVKDAIWPLLKEVALFGMGVKLDCLETLLMIMRKRQNKSSTLTLTMVECVYCVDSGRKIGVVDVPYCEKLGLEEFERVLEELKMSLPTGLPNNLMAPPRKARWSREV